MATASLEDLLALSGAPRHPAVLVGLLLGAAIVSFLVARIASAVANFLRIRAKLASIPSAPGGNWLIGHVIPMLTCVRQNKGAWDVMEDWLNQVGPIVKYRILGTQGVVVRDPLSMKRVFQNAFKIYQKDLDLSYRPFLPILGTGLVTADGQLWQDQRKLMGPALRVEVLDDIIEITHRAVDRLTAKWQQHVGSGKPFDLEEEYRLLTLQIIGEAVLSLAPEECDRVFPQLYLPVMTEANRRVLRPYRMYLPTPEWFRFHSRMKKLNSFLIDIFRRRWQQRQAGSKPARPDILDRILDAIQEAGTKWDSKLEQQLCYECKTFLLAGHETSAAMLTWSTLELARNEEYTQKVLAEAETVFGSAEAEPSRRSVDDMLWTLSVLKEALRKYSVVPVVTRKLGADDEVGLNGHPLPRGSMICLHIQANHRMYEEPMAFKPERFMPGGEYDQFDDAIRAFMFLPFIQGPRNCLGQHFALLEARVVLALLHKRFRFRLAHPERAGERHPTVIPVGPVGGLEVYLEPQGQAK